MNFTFFSDFNILYLKSTHCDFYVFLAQLQQIFFSFQWVILSVTLLRWMEEKKRIDKLLQSSIISS